MLNVRVVCPEDLATRVLDYLTGIDSVINVVHLRGVARKPNGDLVTCDVAREDGSVVLAMLRELGCETAGTVVAETIEVSLSDAARRAARLAPGSAADAVLWEEVTAQTSESAELSFSFALFMIVASLITATAILCDSVVVLIGGMVVGPEFGPIAGVCVALVQGRRDLARRSAVALAVGFALAVLASAALTALLIEGGVAPPVFGATHPKTLFISHPDLYSAIIALLAGVAGMYSLTTSKPSALIGVFISVTTIPAAANMGVAAAYQDVVELRGATTQLALNLSLMILTGIVTLLLQRAAFVKRWRRRTRAPSK